MRSSFRIDGSRFFFLFSFTSTLLEKKRKTSKKLIAWPTQFLAVFRFIKKGITCRNLVILRFDPLVVFFPFLRSMIIWYVFVSYFHVDDCHWIVWLPSLKRQPGRWWFKMDNVRFLVFISRIALKIPNKQERGNENQSKTGSDERREGERERENWMIQSDEGSR